MSLVRTRRSRRPRPSLPYAAVDRARGPSVRCARRPSLADHLTTRQSCLSGLRAPRPRAGSASTLSRPGLSPRAAHPTERQGRNGARRRVMANEGRSTGTHYIRFRSSASQAANDGVAGSRSPPWEPLPTSATRRSLAWRGVPNPWRAPRSRSATRSLESRWNGRLQLPRTAINDR